MKTFKYDVLVIGSGASGFAAANRIKLDGRKKVALITENIKYGTSRNTGSDKQTYYKLGIAGDALDSVENMTKNLFNGGCVDGDNALCEAALSPRCFMNLVELGVPFPCTRYGEYIGYKTDHDPFARATSAGPLTSKFMTEKLETQAKTIGLKIFNSLYATEVITNDNKVVGLICINTNSQNIYCFMCPNIILATGGPSNIYYNSVYPTCHCGSTSLAIKAGAKLQNFTEWQYGLASINPRWNVSGTYMQVLPRFVSIDKKGNEYDFIGDYFEDKYKALSNIFLKGYQWPFDSNKVLNGSSIIDLLVYQEIAMKERKVFLDFNNNPFGLKNIDFKKLDNDAYMYLKKADALLAKPIDRLKKMNKPAIDLYLHKGCNLYNNYLEISLCAQHNNGGIAVDKWWQTEVKGLFAIGECAGTHGVVRAGGTALNAGQVGALRAAQYIAETKDNMCDDKKFSELSTLHLKNLELKISKNCISKPKIKNVQDFVSKLMSKTASAIRIKDEIINTHNQIKSILDNEYVNIKAGNIGELVDLLKLHDTLICSDALTYSIIDYINTICNSRGSALYQNNSGVLRDGLEECFRFLPDNGKNKNKVQIIEYKNDYFSSRWRNVRDMPTEDKFFENVWNSFRINKNIF